MADPRTLQNSDILQGNAIQVWVGDECIAFATSHSFSMSVNTQEIATKDHGYTPAVLATNYTWEISCESLYATYDVERLIGIAQSRQEVDIKMCEVGNYSTYGQQGIIGVASEHGTAWTANMDKVTAKGKAIITSFSVNAPTGDNASISCTFTGSGAFTYGDLNP